MLFIYPNIVASKFKIKKVIIVFDIIMYLYIYVKVIKIYICVKEHPKFIVKKVPLYTSVYLKYNVVS